jgi:hypothetical protein
MMLNNLCKHVSFYGVTFLICISFYGCNGNTAHSTAYYSPGDGDVGRRQIK